MTGSMLPPDIREQMQGSRRPGGVGAGAPENSSSSKARSSALKESAPATPVAAGPEEAKACVRCKEELNADWRYCAKCGVDLIKGGAA